MDAFEQTERYRNYLRRFGIAEAGDRVMELHTLRLTNVGFFAYESSDGLRLKAAVTPGGMVTPGAHAGDDWYGLLSEATDAATAAERVAWLETDSSTQPHGLPRDPVLLLDPDRRPAIGIDPAEWALVTAPTLSRHADGSITLVAWFLPGGVRVPERWSVTARANAAATIERRPASDLLASNAGGADAAAADAETRARELLNSGTDDERLWAVQRVAKTAGPADVPNLAKLLGDPSAAENIKVLATAALANCADATAAAALGVALRENPLAPVRRACAQALGRLGGAEAVSELAESVAHEPEVLVRAEIVNALAGQGGVAREALAVIAREDPDDELRALARRRLEAGG